VAVYDDAQLVALAPLFCEDGALGRRLLPIGISLSDYLDVLIDPACPEAAVALLDAMMHATEWDACCLEELAPGAAALALSSPVQLHDKVERQSACPVLTLPTSVEKISETVPMRKLRKLRMARNRAGRRLGFAIEDIPSSKTGFFLDELFRLHGARWKQQGEAGVLDEEHVRYFHRVAAPALAAAGIARMTLMSIEERVVGAHYGFVHRSTAFAYLGGFDPAFAFESPGTVLMGHAIEAAIAEGCGEFHFLRGQEPYKYEWGAVDRWSLRRILTREAAHA
jgi:CelD/BcsL family acetyltransferase involved in cellulose biosynthesis